LTNYINLVNTPSSMIIGIVGKPSAGKSTFFKAATLAEAEIGNYPFTTIKPNHGVGFVKVDDVAKEFNVVSNPRMGYVENGFRFIPVDLMDVAGLVPGASEGLGMGNQFLDDLRQADVLIHIVDISGSTNEKGEALDPLTYDPAHDVRFLEVELDMWYLGIIKKGWEKFARQVVQEKGKIQTALAKQLSGLRVTEEMVESVLEKNNFDTATPNKWDESQLKTIARELRKRTKPMVIACNKIDVPGAEKNFEKLKEEFKEYIFIPCSAESELALKEAAKKESLSYIPGEASFEITTPEAFSPEQIKALEFIKENVLKKHDTTGVQDTLNKAVFSLLKYVAIYPGGVKKLQDSQGRVLPDCFLMPPNTTALDFAYKLHTDFGKNFIRAIDVKTKMSIGKEHKLNHQDIIEIVSGK